MQRKVLTATIEAPSVAMVLDISSSNELGRAAIIEEAQKQLVYKMRQALERQMAELTRNDLNFKLEEL